MDIPTEAELKRFQYAYYYKNRTSEDMDILRRFGSLGNYIEMTSSTGNRWYEFSLTLAKQKDKDETFADGWRVMRLEKKEHTPEEAAMLMKAGLYEKDQNYMPDHPISQYCCLVCPSSFICSSDLTRHEITHSDARPFHCAICKIRFTLRANMRRHLVHSHPVRDSPAIIDPNKRTERKINGKIVYPCPFEGCSRICKKQSELEIHNRKHTKEQPFVCECKRSFISKSNLTRHVRICHK